jgi:23S rRNA (guanosine2251-2'-O)-methyltransferase
MGKRSTETILFGIHSVYEALASDTRPIQRLHVSRGNVSEKLSRIVDMANDKGIPVRRESREALSRIASNAVHQGVVAVVSARPYASLEVVLEHDSPLLVVLDGVEDPQNLGAVIRTAETAGASGLVVAERRTAPLTAAVSRASAGALEHLPVAQVPNLVAAVKTMKKNGLWVIGVHPRGTRLWTDFDYSVPVALVFGGEHGGIHRLVRENCDLEVRLPVHGKIDSLNVSVAAGVVLYEVVRQRLVHSLKAEAQKSSVSLRGD